MAQVAGENQASAESQPGIAWSGQAKPARNTSGTDVGNRIFNASSPLLNNLPSNSPTAASAAAIRTAFSWAR